MKGLSDMSELTAAEREAVLRAAEDFWELNLANKDERADGWTDEDAANVLRGLRKMEAER